jgi:hypothetical protein
VNREENDERDWMEQGLREPGDTPLQLLSIANKHPELLVLFC